MTLELLNESYLFEHTYKWQTDSSFLCMYYFQKFTYFPKWLVQFAILNSSYFLDTSEKIYGLFKFKEEFKRKVTDTDFFLTLIIDCDPNNLLSIFQLNLESIRKVPFWKISIKQIQA